MSRFVRVPCVHSTLERGLSGIICLGSLAGAFFAQTASHAKFTKTLLTIRFLFAYSSPAAQQNWRTTMSIAQTLLPEFEQEMANTRKVLERVPDEKWNWKPHEKSGTTGWLAAHVGTVPGWLTMTLPSESLDHPPVDGPKFTPPQIEQQQRL